MTYSSVQAPIQWSGRFSEGMDERLKHYNASIPFDYKLAFLDIQASVANAKMLASQNIISQKDFLGIETGLNDILDEIRLGTFSWSVDLEDVHFNIERRLTEQIGDAGKRLHTARSRNDQIATVMRLYLRQATDNVIRKITELQTSLVDRAALYADLIMPGFTHLQVAQPVTFGHHLLAYYEMLARDSERFIQCQKRANTLPLGSAALAGTSFPIDREMVARELGFHDISHNSIDGVSDRDFVLDFLAASSILMVHLSRLAEELILWSTSAFAFVDIPDKFCTGSSIMPQKKNPDVPELARGKTGRVVGHLTAMLMVMKGQPLAYNKDNQEGQEALFDTEQTVVTTLDVFSGMVAGLRPNKERMRLAAEQGHATATDLADHLVRKGVAFRDAHEIVARVVRLAEQRKTRLDQLEIDDVGRFIGEVLAISPVHAKLLVEKELSGVLSLQGSVDSRSHIGGTAPTAVRREIARARAMLILAGARGAS